MPRRRKDGGGSESLPLELAQAEPAPLADEARARYLNYALSVITARALPDVRDGLKPVQRRILYTMFQELKLRSDARYRKSAAVVGEVMGKFHPHGDSAIYDALVRLAQSFMMRMPLVDGRGNFGSPDGDGAAAMRYTEAKLMPLADTLMTELSQQTVALRPNYDGTRQEPVVLPARFPNLLVNGSQGIAVGMATSIPPHAPREVIDACLKLILRPDIEIVDLIKTLKGPDFPTGGELVASPQALLDIYTKGQGSLTLRGEWRVEEGSARERLFVITSIPYGIERCTLVERIAAQIIDRKLPLLTDVRDESTDDCRVVCEMRNEAQAEQVASYLYKHTPLATHVAFNLTCLVPIDEGRIAAPRRLNLKEMLRYFLDFRMEVTTKRLAYDLGSLEARIHLLEGFEIIFADVDEVVRIIRSSDGRKEAHQSLCKRFGLSDKQSDAILELRLYRLAKLEVFEIERELADKRSRADALRKLLESESDRWNLIAAELSEIKESFRSKRLTRVIGHAEEVAIDAESLIVDEAAVVVLTAQGWVKRQQKLRDAGATRVRDGDSVLATCEASTRRIVTFFSDQGYAYSTFVAEVPPTTGYGVPIQSLFKLRDGEQIIGLALTDAAAPAQVLFATQGGFGARVGSELFAEPSTRAGRRFARVAEGDAVLAVMPCVGESSPLVVLSAAGRLLRATLGEVSLLGGPGKGVTLMRLEANDEVLLVCAPADEAAVIVAEHDSGKQHRVRTKGIVPSKRGGKGGSLFKRGRLIRAMLEVPPGPVL